MPSQPRTPLRKMPLTLAAAAWLLLAGDSLAQRDLTDIPKPNPAAEQSAMTVDHLAAVNLFAADPDIRKPIQMNFDSTGGLWIASSEVYPQILPGEKANDKIIVLRDSDGDGSSDTATVFADGLLIPTGVIPDGPHAAYVAESTRLVYLQDTDHDGKADSRRVVMSGFGTEDTHHLVHTLRWGPDGCLYFNQSIYIHSHIDTPYGTRHLDGGGIWRYRPSSGRLEVFCKGFVNPWGHVFDPYGESFATDGAYFEGINYVFPDSVFATSPGATRWLQGLNPGSPKLCGLEILSGTHIPPQWSGDFVANDFRSHRVCRFTVQPDGSGYVSRQQPEIIRSEHVAFRPIDARMGPDGALYIADWYNPIIQHGEVDFRDQRRDRKHGRIWRVSFPNRQPDPWPNFAALSDQQLVSLLEDPALPIRQFARQELWTRAAQSPDRIVGLIKHWADADDDASRYLEVLWMNEVVGRASLADFTTILAKADDSDAPMRRTLLRSIWRSRIHLSPDSPEYAQLVQLVAGRTDDEDAAVRLEAVVSNGQVRGVQAARRVAAATDKEVDANLDFAIWQSLRQLDHDHQGSIVSDIDWQGRYGQLAFAVRAIGTPDAAEIAVQVIEQGTAAEEIIVPLIQSAAASGNPDQLGRVLKTLLQGEAVHERSPRLFDALLARTSRDGTVPTAAGPLLAATVPTDKALLDHPQWGAAIARAAAAWKAEPLEKVFTKALSHADGELRNQLIAALGSFSSATATATIANLAESDDPESRIAATAALVSARPRGAVDATVKLLSDQATVDAGSNLVAKLMKRRDLPPLLADAIKKQGLTADHARSLLRIVRSSGGEETLENAIRQAGNLDNAAWKLTPELANRILSAARSNGNPQRGETVYRREQLQCIKCHAIGTAGGLVGPNLISIGGSSQPDYILESLIDPSAKLKEGFTTLTVLTDSDEVVNGIVVGKTDQSLQLRLADGVIRQIDVDEIVQQKPGKSLMPVGNVDSLTEQELVDLVAFLFALGRQPEFTVSTDAVVRSFESLIYTDAANRRLNRTSTDTAASGDPAMNWKPLTGRVDGTLPIEEMDRFQQHRETPPTSFARFVVEIPSAGSSAGIELPGDGIEAWVDTKPTPVGNLKTLQLTPGNHTIVIALDRTVVTDPFAVRLTGDAIEPVNGSTLSPP